MSQTFLIGVDLGTSVVKTSLFNTEGRLKADATRATGLNQPAPGKADQSGEDFVVATLETVREVVERAGIAPSSVAAIAFDGQMAGAMGIDRDWNALTPWYPSALDNRYLPYIDEMVARAGGQVVALNGSLPFMAPRMLWWQDKHPDLYRCIHKVLMLANYVAGRLADLRADDAFIDPSYLTWIGVSDTEGRRWSEELADVCGIPLAKLPRIVPSTEVIGRLSAESASVCGLPAGIPLVAGAGDQVAGCLGAGLVRSGQLVEVAGTFPVLATCLDSYFSDTRYGMLQSLAGPLGADHWYPMMYISGGGLTHRWYRDQFAAPDTLEKIQPAIAETKPDFIYGDALEENFYKYSRPHKKTWQGMFTHHQAMLYRRTALGDLRYDLRYKIAADYDFTIRFLQRAENILYCPFPICLFENGGISQLEALRGRREQFYIRKEAGQNLPGNIFIFAAQTLNLFLRRKCPRLYRFLKMRQRQAGNT